jgi:hypothetical protein
LITYSRDGTARMWKAAPWRLKDYPGDDSMSWQERFRLWKAGQGVKQRQKRIMDQMPSGYWKARYCMNHLPENRSALRMSLLRVLLDIHSSDDDAKHSIPRAIEILDTDMILARSESPEAILDLVEDLKNLAWKRYEAREQDEEIEVIDASTVLVALYAFLLDRLEAVGRPTWLMINDSCEDLHILALCLWEHGYHEESLALLKRTVAGSYITENLGGAFHEEFEEDYLDRKGELPEKPDPLIIFGDDGLTGSSRPGWYTFVEDQEYDETVAWAEATPEMRNAVLDKVHQDSMKYLNRVAPLPDLKALEAKLRADFPPPQLDPNQPFINRMKQILESVELSYLGKPLEAALAEVERTEKRKRVTDRLPSAYWEVRYRVNHLPENRSALVMVLLRLMRDIHSSDDDAKHTIPCPIEILDADMKFIRSENSEAKRSFARDLDDLAWNRYEKDEIDASTMLLSLYSILLMPQEKEFPLYRVLDWVYIHYATLARILWELDYREESLALHKRSVAIGDYFSSNDISKIRTCYLDRGGTMPERPDPSLILGEDGLTSSSRPPWLYKPGEKPAVRVKYETLPAWEDATTEMRNAVLGKIKRDLMEYLNRVAPLPDLKALEAKLRAELPPPQLDPNQPFIDRVEQVLEKIDIAYLGKPLETALAEVEAAE